jgi:hypothetical protein
MLGISPGTVGAHLHRAIATLRGDIAVVNGRASPDAGFHYPVNQAS